MYEQVLLKINYEEHKCIETENIRFYAFTVFSK